MPHPRAKITPEAREELLRRAIAGENHADLAAAFGVSRQRVHILHQRSQDPIWRMKPTRPSLIQFARISVEIQKLKAEQKTKKLISQEQVRQLAFELLGINVDMRHNRSDLRVLGVEIGTRADDLDEGKVMTKEFKKYLKSEQATALREKEVEWLKIEEERQKNRPPPKRGRPRIHPLPADKSATGNATPPPKPDDDDDDPFGLGSLEEMEASIAATRAQMDRANAPASKYPPWYQPHGVRSGKHAHNAQPPKKKRKKRR